MTTTPEEKNKNPGCGLMLIIGIGILVFLLFLGGVLQVIDGVFDALGELPWYLYVFVVIGFVYLMVKLGDLDR